MNTLILANLSIRDLKKVIGIREKIESLTTKLHRLLGASDTSATPGARRGRNKMSAAGRAAIVAAQRARWAKAKVKQGRRKMSAAGRAKIAAAARARWAKVKAAGRNKL